MFDHRLEDDIMRLRQVPSWAPIHEDDDRRTSCLRTEDSDAKHRVLDWAEETLRKIVRGELVPAEPESTEVVGDGRVIDAWRVEELADALANRQKVIDTSGDPMPQEAYTDERVAELHKLVLAAKDPAHTPLMIERRHRVMDDMIPKIREAIHEECAKLGEELVQRAKARPQGRHLIQPEAPAMEQGLPVRTPEIRLMGKPKDCSCTYYGEGQRVPTPTCPVHEPDDGGGNVESGMGASPDQPGDEPEPHAREEEP